MTCKISAVLLLVFSVLAAGPASAKTYGHRHHGYSHHHGGMAGWEGRSHRGWQHQAFHHRGSQHQAFHHRGSRHYAFHHRGWRHGMGDLARYEGWSRRPVRRYARRHHGIGVARLGGGSGQSGIASIYAYRGEPTANGERANPGGLTAAHKTLPFGTRVQVVNKQNGRSVVVRINDRGPFVAGRVIDLTPAGARVLGFSGLAPVQLAVLR